MSFSNQHYDPRKILFFHLDAIYDMHGIVQKWHQPAKHPAVLKPDRPWEGDMTLPESVFPHQSGQKILGLYSCHHHPHRFPDLVKAGFKQVNCLAESADGLHWVKPDVGAAEFQGSHANNIVPGHLYRTILDPHDPDPQRRYKGIALLWPDAFPAGRIEDQRRGRCFYSATSPDAVHWSTPRRMEGFEETGDTDAISYDDRRQLYLVTTRKRGYWLSEAYPEFYKRPVKKGMPDGRWIALSTSRDFSNWTELDNIIVRDAADELGMDFYCACIFPYGDLYVGFLRRHHGWHGLMDTELVWIRDGLRWNRSWNRQPFVSWGELGDDDWCFGDVLNSQPIRSGSQLLIAYEAREHVHGPHNNRTRGLPGYDGHMGLATLRVDGFVSLEAGRMGGDLITEPLPLAGKRITINARTVLDGIIEVALLTADRQPLGKVPVVFHGDNIEFPLEFDGAKSIPYSNSGRVCLSFYLQNAALYSLTIAEA